MLKKILKFFVPAFLLGFLLFNVIQDWGSIVVYKDQLKVTPLILCFLVLLTIYPEGAYGWYLILRKNNLNVSLQQAIRIWIISNSARYIPGKVWQYVGRVEMANNIGIPRNKTISSLLLEVFLVLIAGLFISTLALPYISVSSIGLTYWVGVLIFPLILIHPSVANKVIELLAKYSKRKIEKFDLTLNFNKSLAIIPCFIVNFFLNGLALTLLISATGKGIEFKDFIMYSGFYSASWVLGFVSLISPAGVGVAEVSLAYLLSLSGIELTLASAIALIYRFLLTAAEAVVFLLVLRLSGQKYGKGE